jgi:hypothetical protein
VPISPKFPVESAVPLAEKLPSWYATVNVADPVAAHISPAQLKGLAGSPDVGRTWRGAPDLVNVMTKEVTAGAFPEGGKGS